MEKFIEDANCLIGLALTPKIEPQTPKVRNIRTESFDFSNSDMSQDEARMEKILEEMEILLRRCSEAELKAIATDLEIADMDDKSRRKTLKAIEDKMSATEDLDARCKLMKDMDFPDRLRDEHVDLFRSTPKKHTSEEKVDAFSVKYMIRGEVLQQMERNKLESSSIHEHLEESFRNMGIAGNSKTSTFRRELRISGTIGGKKENRIDYLSLCSQIAEARQKGYADDEISFAIKKAVSPSSEIKGYLDSLYEDINLDDVLTCIRSSYQEKSISELFQDLTKLCQNNSEDAQAFLFRGLGLRQKVQAASDATDEINYETSLIQSTFLHAILTGIKSESVRSHMKPYLDQKRRTKDKELIEEMGRACAEENERMSKMGGESRRQCPRVNEVSSGIEQLVKPLAEQLSALGEQMKEVQSQMLAMKKERKPSRNKSKCKACTQNEVKFCRHCFKCGKDGHMSRNCQGQKVQSNPSN